MKRRIVLALFVAWTSSVAHADDAAERVAKIPEQERRVILDAAPDPRSVDERMEEVRARVQDAAFYPPLAHKHGVEGEALVAFEIDDDGTPRAIETAKTSGSLALDRAAEEAVQKAAPLPWIYGRVAVPVRFQLRDAD